MKCIGMDLCIHSAQDMVCLFILITHACLSFWKILRHCLFSQSLSGPPFGYMRDLISLSYLLSLFLSVQYSGQFPWFFLWVH